MRHAILTLALLGLVAGLALPTIAETEDSGPFLAIEMLARDEKVIPLAYVHGEYHCLHVKPPELLVRNISNRRVTLTRASLVGRSEGREIARSTIHEDRISELMPAQNERINEYLSNIDDTGMAYRLRRIHGEPAIMAAGYHEGHELPPSTHACLGLDDALFFVYEGTTEVDALEITIEAKDTQGRTSAVTVELPYINYTCQNEYHFPIEGMCTVGSIPIGHSHRFANGQEFALDILDIRRFEDGSFSTSTVPNPMVIMGSDQASDYYIYGRPVRAMADGIVIGIENRYPDEFAANPKTPFSQRDEQLKKHLVARGEDPDDIPRANHVFIDHGHGEHARYCHLREEVPVKIGDRVRRGDVIGYVGNSGQSMEPHLHLELLDSPDYLTANGLPIVFDNLDLTSALDSPTFSAMNSFVFSEFIFVISE